VVLISFYNLTRVLPRTFPSNIVANTSGSSFDETSFTISSLISIFLSDIQESAHLQSKKCALFNETGHLFE